MEMPDWLSFFLFLIDVARLYPVEWSSVSPSSMLRWFDKGFPVQPHESRIPRFNQLYFCQSVDICSKFHYTTGIRLSFRIHCWKKQWMAKWIWFLCSLLEFVRCISTQTNNFAKDSHFPKRFQYPFFKWAISLTLDDYKWWECPHGAFYITLISRRNQINQSDSFWSIMFDHCYQAFYDMTIFWT